jgi:chemotaxis protein MotB
MRVLGWIFVMLLLVGAAAGSYWAKLKYDTHMAAFANYQTEAQSRKDDLDKVNVELAQDKLARAETEKVAESVKADLHATNAELAELRQQRAETERRLAAFRQVTTRLQKMIDTGKLNVLIRNGRMIVKLPAEVLFPSGKADLASAGESALAEVAMVLKEFNDRKWMIAGHTDNLPVNESGYKNNRDLSMARAYTVTEFLIKSGMKPGTLVSAGYAEFDPVASNASPVGRRENRRIEIVLLPNIEELPRLLDKASAVVSASAPAAPPPKLATRRPARALPRTFTPRAR